MIFKKKLLFLVACLSILSINGQQVIATQGSSSSNSAGSLDYTIGEVVVTFGSDDSTHLTQGFHQPVIRVTNIETIDISFEVSIYPNPAVDHLNISFKEINKGTRFDLYDAAGKLILTKLITSQLMVIPFSGYETGVYFLSFISSENRLLKTFKVQKSY